MRGRYSLTRPQRGAVDGVMYLGYVPRPKTAERPGVTPRKIKSAPEGAYKPGSGTGQNIDKTPQGYRDDGPRNNSLRHRTRKVSPRCGKLDLVLFLVAQERMGDHGRATGRGVPPELAAAEVAVPSRAMMRGFAAVPGIRLGPGRSALAPGGV